MAFERKRRRKMPCSAMNSEPALGLRADASLMRQGINVRLLRENLDLSTWHSPPRGWVIAYAFRLCDPTENKGFPQIAAELGIDASTGWRYRQKEEFRDLMLQIHALRADEASFFIAYRVLCQLAFDGNIAAIKLLFQMMGKLPGAKSGVVPTPTECFGAPAELDDLAKEERMILEQLELIRRRNPPDADDGKE